MDFLANIMSMPRTMSVFIANMLGHWCLCQADFLDLFGISFFRLHLLQSEWIFTTVESRQRYMTLSSSVPAQLLWQFVLASASQRLQPYSRMRSTDVITGSGRLRRRSGKPDLRQKLHGTMGGRACRHLLSRQGRQCHRTRRHQSQTKQAKARL